jgi:hypothetical protein
MSEEVSKTELKTKTTRELRAEVMDTFIAKSGKISNMKLAAIYHIDRSTISRWRAKDDWDNRLLEVQREASKKAATRMANKLSTNYEAMLETDIEHLKILDQVVASKLFARDSAGTFLRDSDGKLQINANLSPNDICSLMRTKETKVKLMRLLTGQSTENQSINAKVSGKIDFVHKLDGAGMMIEKAAIESLKPVFVHRLFNGTPRAFPCNALIPLIP